MYFRHFHILVEMLESTVDNTLPCLQIYRHYNHCKTFILSKSVKSYLYMTIAMYFDTCNHRESPLILGLLYHQNHSQLHQIRHHNPIGYHSASKRRCIFQTQCIEILRNCNLNLTQEDKKLIFISF